jgi:hypothetical protein
MIYAILTGNTITAHGSASMLWPDTSFAATGPNANFLADAGAVPIRSDAPYVPATEMLVSCSPYLLNGKAFDCIAAPLPPAPEPDPEPDWNAYRLALRDPAYVNIVAAAFTSTVDAVYGAANISAALNSFQYQGQYQDYLECILLIMAGSTLSPVEKAGIATGLLAMFNQCHLPSDFIAAFEAATSSLLEP